ncbi:MAG: hypothetical protein NDP16_00175 [Crenarchaeota archaeon]|nr:hypothetical protein [Thermoproteota archaeon]MCR8470708.1 hypothetical protein [Thermoproteota archaeon]MCR8472768.1 hypothetical protein [Thermoproteota archaeon]
MIKERLFVALLTVIFPWVALTFAVPIAALCVFKASGNQYLGYFVALLAFVVFLISWYHLSILFLRKNLER